MKTRKALRAVRKRRVRAHISGTAERPRMSVYRSHKAIMVQLIDDEKAVTLVAKRLPGENIPTGKKIGMEVAALALAKGIKTVVFDRSGYRYHGVVAAIADGAREGGLKI